MVRSARHLGVPIGPTKPWLLAERAWRVRSSSRSPLEALAMHMVYVASALAYRLQHRGLDARRRLAEDATLVISMAIPMRAIPTRVVGTLTAFGIRTLRRTYDHVSLAARARVALCSLGHSEAVARMPWSQMRCGLAPALISGTLIPSPFRPKRREWPTLPSARYRPRWPSL